MIYLIQVEYKTTTLLKIGYTKDSSKENRFRAYKMHNPLSEVLFIISEGTEEHEKALHYLFRRYLYQDYGNEWFNYNEEIINFFSTHTTRESLDKDLVIFKKEDYNKLYKQIKNIVSKLIFCNLEINIKELINECKDRVGSIICTEDDIYSYLINKYNLTEELQNKLRGSLKSNKTVVIFSEESKNKVQEFLDNKFYKTGIFKEKMKLYCEFMDENKDNSEISELLYIKIRDPKFREYYSFYGTSGCKAVRYEEKPLKEGMLKLSKEDKLFVAIHKSFKIGDRYTIKYIKSTIGNIYKNLEITTKAKATDLEKYFKLTKTKITLEDKSLENGYKLEEKVK